MGNRMNPEYEKRNRDVAKAYGVPAGINAIRERMALRKDCPLWLLEKLDEEFERASQLIQPLIERRNEVKKILPFSL